MDAPDAAPDPATRAAADARALAASVSGFVAAWRALLDAELALAGRSLRALAIGAAFAPLLLLGIWLSLITLSLLALHAAGLGWLPAGALSCVLQALLAWWLLRALRRWSRDLSLPYTRTLLARLLEPPA